MSSLLSNHIDDTSCLKSGILKKTNLNDFLRQFRARKSIYFEAYFSRFQGRR